MFVNIINFATAVKRCWVDVTTLSRVSHVDQLFVPSVEGPIPSSALQQGFLELQTHAIAINSRKAKVLAAEYGKEADMQISANYLHHHRLVHCLDLPGWQGSCIAFQDLRSKGPVLPHEYYPSLFLGKRSGCGL